MGPRRGDLTKHYRSELNDWSVPAQNRYRPAIRLIHRFQRRKANGNSGAV
jgi:hypothetical protein